MKHFKIACDNKMPPEVILALVLVDLPFNLNGSRKDGLEGTSEEKGRSWWYIACECEDRYSGVVEEVLRVCSYPEIRKLCFAERKGLDQTLIHHAR